MAVTMTRCCSYFCGTGIGANRNARNLEVCLSMCRVAWLSWAREVGNGKEHPELWVEPSRWCHASMRLHAGCWLVLSTTRCRPSNSQTNWWKKKRNSKDCFKFKEGRAGAFGLWSFGYGSDVSETGCVEACKLVDWKIFREELGWRLSLSDLHR